MFGLTKQFWIILFTFLIAGLSFYIFVVQNYQLVDAKRFEQLEQIEKEHSDANDQNNDQPSDEQDNTDDTSENQNEDNLLWGVDSVSITTEDFYDCVTTNFGQPTVWARYLMDKENVSNGLTQQEIELFKDEGIYILPIYNHFEDATGYENGVAQAKQAIDYANEYGIPEGVALFADIEPSYPVTSDFIIGWHETIMASKYESGIYGVFSDDSDLTAAFNAAVEENAQVLEQTIIWSNQPQVGITTEEDAPDYQVNAPESSRDWAWQYGLESDICNIDTNLFRSNIIEYLW